MKLSVVIATRGDNYGGDPAAKAVKFTRRLIKKMAKIGENSYEVILVDYNFVETNRIKHVIPVEMLEFVKIIEVPRSHLKDFASEQVPFIEFHAKNIGIKRAKGAQILVANSDVVISRKLLLACLHRPYLNSSYLRADRTDLTRKSRFRMLATLQIRNGETHDDPMQLKLKNLRFFIGSKRFTNEIRINSYIVSREGGDSNFPLFGAYGNAAGDFLCAPNWAWMEARGYQESKFRTFMGDSFLLCAFLQLGLRQVILPGLGRLVHLDHLRPIDHRTNWGELNWISFQEDFNAVVIGKNPYKTPNETWGEFARPE